jgi:hypothetical protein
MFVHEAPPGTQRNQNEAVQSPELFIHEARGFEIWDIDDAAFAANSFDGFGRGLLIFGIGQTATGNTVSGNDMGKLNQFFDTNTPDVLLTNGTQGNYVGPDQGALILDDGSQNIVITEGNEGLIVPAPNTQNGSAAYVNARPQSLKTLRMNH